MSEPEEVAYLVEPTRSAEAELDRIPDKDWQRVQRDLEGLARDPRPRNAIKLDDDTYRLRRGDWRIIYHIYDDERYVLIGAARRRNERTYKGIDRLFRAHR